MRMHETSIKAFSRETPSSGCFSKSLQSTCHFLKQSLSSEIVNSSWHIPEVQKVSQKSLNPFGSIWMFLKQKVAQKSTSSWHLPEAENQFRSLHIQLACSSNRKVAQKSGGPVGIFLKQGSSLEVFKFVAMFLTQRRGS